MASVRGPRKQIGQILLERGSISEEQLEQALQVQKSTKEMLGRILADLGYVNERQVLEAHADQIGVPFIDLSKTKIDDSVRDIIPAATAERYNAVAIRRENNRLVVAMSDPSNVFAIDDIRFATQGMEIEPVLASVEDIAASMRGRQAAAPATGGGSGPRDPGTSAVDLGAAVAELTQQGTGGGKGGMNPFKGGASPVPAGVDADVAEDHVGGAGELMDTDRLEQLAEEAPIIRVVNVMIQNAIKDRASDIHVEPDRRNLRVRYRVDGVLHVVMPLPRHLHAPLTSRIKIMADMNIAERRLPQDGRIHVRHENKDYDLRVSSVPTVYGEKVVMRILDQSSILIGLNKLGLFPETQAQLEELIVQPNGMLLSTGPTGSGKTTTQYSVLNKINSVEKNITTIEEPVEYQLPGINQVTVNRKAGLTFSNAMRNFVRQDPDIIMVGEIRDLETAEIAIQSSLTGHLVLSTLHTNDAPSAVTRMTDMGVEPFLISASVIGILAQRLARRVCPQCKESYKPPVDAIVRMGMPAEEAKDLVLYRGRGCDHCRHTGYYDRIGIFELMTMNEEIQDLVVKRAPLSEIREAALLNGMKTLKQDGFQKVLEGTTTLEELMHVVFTAGGMSR